MLHFLELNIHEKLAEYLAGEISLREFEDWFFPETWDVDQKEIRQFIQTYCSAKECVSA